jgi:hypothetical protein
MSSITTNPARRATRAHRAQIVAEAVVSAYIHEITPPERPRERARTRQRCTDSSPRAINHLPLAARALEWDELVDPTQPHPSVRASPSVHVNVSLRWTADTFPKQRYRSHGRDPQALDCASAD